MVVIIAAGCEFADTLINIVEIPLHIDAAAVPDALQSVRQGRKVILTVTVNDLAVEFIAKIPPKTCDERSLIIG